MPNFSCDKCRQLMTENKMTHPLQETKAANASSMGIRSLVMSLSPTTHSRNQATLHPLTIRHDSLFKAVWDWLVLLLVIYTAIEIPYTAAFVLKPVMGNVVDWTMKESPTLQAVNIWVDLMFVLDILINFRTTYVEPKTEEIVSNPRQIALHYLKSWFVVDFVAAVPFEFMVNRDQGATNLVGLLKTARLLRLVRVARKLDRYSEYGLAVVVLLTALFSLLAHWLACLWHVIGASEISNTHGWLYVLSKQLTGVPINGSQSTWPDVKTRYVTSMYFTLSSLTSVGFGNISPNTNAEKVFSVCIMLGGALMYASIFGNMTAIIQRLYSRTSKYHNEVRRIDDFVKFYKIPKSLRERLEDYFRHEWLYTKGVDMNVVLKRFPESLQADICAHLHRNLFQQCTAFKTASEGCLRALALRFSARHFLPGHYIIKQGDEVKRLYFVAKGTIDVVQNGQTIISLAKGDVISCDNSYTYQLLLANASLLVTTHTEIHMIDWKELLVVLKAYPKFRAEFLSQLDLAYNLGSQPQQSDDRMTYDLDCIQITPEGLSTNKQNIPGSSYQAPKGLNSFDPSLVNGQVPGHVETVPTEHFSTGFPLSPSSLGLIRNVERRINSLETKLERMENKFATSFDEILAVLKNTRKKDHVVAFVKPENKSSTTTSV